MLKYRLRKDGMLIVNIFFGFRIIENSDRVTGDRSYGQNDNLVLRFAASNAGPGGFHKICLFRG